MTIKALELSHNRTSRYVAHKTTFERDTSQDDVYCIRYHDTKVVTWHVDEQGVDWVILRAGGWHTPTTKRRINDTLEKLYLPFRVVQRDYEWYIIVYDHDPDGSPFKRTYEFQDGIAFYLRDTFSGLQWYLAHKEAYDGLQDQS